MRYRVGDTGDEIEIGQYREVSKGALKAFFSLVIYSPPPYTKQDKMIECRYFCIGDKRWFTFPQKEVKFDDGRKSEFIPYRCYGDKTYLEYLKQAVLQALKEAKPQESHGKTYYKTPQRQKSPVPAYSPPDWEDTPF